MDYHALSQNTRFQVVNAGGQNLRRGGRKYMFGYKMQNSRDTHSEHTE